ncbi:CDP-diacylglycerol/serine O-phosphatidyltransferase [Alicycliphilus sp. B1]|nr:CDP-diacylglycerol/serine O-phosphatidyltransferase [Alicycliphilus sp. B1]
MLVGLLALAASTGAVREHLWLGKMMIGGFTLHPLVLLFALVGLADDQPHPHPQAVSGQALRPAPRARRGIFACE